MPLAAGSRLGTYEIGALIGAGAMGEVYRARDLKLGRDVALKVLPESFAGEPERLSRFRREAQVLASLNHPNIAHIHGLEESGSLHALVMELVEGVTLEELIDRQHVRGQVQQGEDEGQAGGAKSGGLALAATLAVVRQLAEALEVAHEQGIVHRDLKPANVKVREDGVVKVLDFGLARVMATDNGAGLDAMNAPTMTGHETQFGAILGTAAYMSPEQARGKAVDRRADIWAFGALTYEMLTGVRAFKGRNTAQILDAVLHQDVDWALLPPDTPPRLVRMLRRCLERDPKRRLRDIGEARITLEALSGPRRRAGEPAEPRPRPAVELVREVGASRIEPLPVARETVTRQWPALRMVFRDVAAVAAVAAFLLAGRSYTATRPVGARVESVEYAMLQQLMLPASDAAASWQPDDPRLPIVIDISHLRVDRSAPTDRAKLGELIDTLRAMNAAAIGIDVDFSPDDAGNFITTQDPLLFAKWAQYGNVRLGVFRREGDAPKTWLGKPEFQTLAAGIMLPRSEAGLAIQYVSPDLSRADAKVPVAHADYLLQMPSALYEISHPGVRAELIDSPLLGRARVDNRILLGQYPVDFSFLRLIDVIPYKEHGNLDLWAKKIDRRVIIVGDTSDSSDVRCTQVSGEPVSGVRLHATALATLNQGILRFVDTPRSLVYDVYACLGALLTIWGFRRLAQTTALHDRLDARAVDTLAFGAAALVVLVAGCVAIAWMRIFWPDPLWLAACLLAVPYVKDVWAILLGGFRGTRPATTTSSGRTTHVG